MELHVQTAAMWRKFSGTRSQFAACSWRTTRQVGGTAAMRKPEGTEIPIPIPGTTEPAVLLLRITCYIRA
jgi:hypothetical protein